MTGEPKRLYRSRGDVKIAGVLAGIADYFGFDPSWVRIAYVIATLVTGLVPLTFLYIVMMFVVPKEPKGSKGAAVTGAG